MMSSRLIDPKFSILIPSRHVLKNEFPCKTFKNYPFKLDHCCLKREVLLAAADSSARDSHIDPIEQERVPKHIGLSPDGHRRWAKSRNLPMEDGYRAMAKGTKQLAIKCSQLGVRVFTPFLFTTNNGYRPQDEVDLCMTVLEDMLKSDFPELASKYNIRTKVIGDRSRLPESLQSVISATEVASKENTGMILLLGLRYGGRYDIIQATKNIAGKVKEGVYKVEDIDATVLDQHLETSCVELHKCPDLWIRTGGELRSSDFMLYQFAYTEMYFTNKMFPDFDDEDLLEAIRAFQKRDRRFGGKKVANEGSIVG